MGVKSGVTWPRKPIPPEAVPKPPKESPAELKIIIAAPPRTGVGGYVTRVTREIRCDVRAQAIGPFLWEIICTFSVDPTRP